MRRVRALLRLIFAFGQERLVLRAMSNDVDGLQMVKAVAAAWHLAVKRVDHIDVKGRVRTGQDPEEPWLDLGKDTTAQH